MELDPMRLAAEQIRLIPQTVSRWAGDGANVYLFGSRLNDKAKGGDVTCWLNLMPRYR